MRRVICSVFIGVATLHLLANFSKQPWNEFRISVIWLTLLQNSVAAAVNFWTSPLGLIILGVWAWFKKDEPEKPAA